MKRRNYMRLTVLTGLIAAFTYYAGCSVDYPTASKSVLAPITTGGAAGTANFTKFVVVGNSLTAGYQSGGLSEKYQVNSYGAQIARQLGIDDSAGYMGSGWEQPLVADPGTTGILFLNNATTSPSPVTNPSNNFKNIAYAAPYNNLGVPGSFVYDFLNATASTNSYSKLFFGTSNTLFDAILRGIGSQYKQLKAQTPTFVIWWEGHNDILGYATNGAGINGVPGGSTPPYTPRSGPEATAFGFPSTITFSNLYQADMDSLASISGAKFITGNIPYVTDIPYFTTILGSSSFPKDTILVTNVQTGSTAKVYYIENADSIQYLCLPLSSVIGKTTIPGFTGKPYGLHPAAKVEGKYSLTFAEVRNIKAITDSYNLTISTIAAAKGIPVVDFNAFFTDVATNGRILPGGVPINAKFISGGIFSLDGVHPSALGYSIVANEFIDGINAFYGSTIPNVNESDYVGGY